MTMTNMEKIYGDKGGKIDSDKDEECQVGLDTLDPMEFFS